MFEAGQRYFIDSNVFLYAAAQDSPMKQNCLHTLQDLDRQNAIPVTNAAVLEEVHFVYWKQTGGAKECIQLLKDITKGLGEVFPISLDVAFLAWELFLKTRGLAISVKDYYHVASMLCFGIEAIISCDSDFDHFSEIRRIDPRELHS